MAKKLTKAERYHKNIKIMLDALHAALEAWKAGERWGVSISEGNKKMGAIPSVSTLPLVTCCRAARETCGCEDCYAVKIAALRPNVAAAYARNTVLKMLAPELFWGGIALYVYENKCPAFRLDVSGELRDAADFWQAYEIAESNQCKMLVFTKRYKAAAEFIRDLGGMRREYLQIVLSAWPGLEMHNPYNLPVSLVLEKGEPVPDDVMLCGGNCFNCICRGVGCWTMKRGDKIAFYKH